MPTQLAPVAAVNPTAATPGPDLIHIVCCNPNLALCGTDVTREPWCNGQTVNCRLCAIAEEENLPCTGCRRGHR